MRVVAIVSAFNEADIVEQVLADLIRQRVEVYFLDNGSTDATFDLANRFLNRGVIGVERFPDNGGGPLAQLYEWERILQRKAQLAQSLDAEWFIHHDADEFREGPWPERDLHDSIAAVDRLGYNAIDFELLNFWPTHDAFTAGQDVRAAFDRYEPGEPWNKVQIRCWKKTNASVDLASTGGHEAIFPGRRIFPIRFLLRHYPIRSRAHGMRKVFDERRPRFSNEERGRGWHIQYDRFQNADDFIRDPAELIIYDPDAVRLQLLVRNRVVEELENDPTTATRLAEQSSRYTSRIEADLDARNHDVERLEQELDRHQRHEISLDAELDTRNRRIIELEQSLDARNRRIEALERAWHEANTRVLQLEADVDTANHRGLAMETQLNDLNQRCADLEGRLTASVHESESFHRDLDLRNRRLASFEQELDASNRELERLRAIEHEFNLVRLETDTLKSALDSGRLEIERREEQRRQTDRQQAEVELKLGVAVKRLAERDAELAAIHKSLLWRVFHPRGQ